MTDNHDQKNSPSYRLAALDQDFILGDSTRGARFMLEYQKAEDNLRARGIVSTIVVFGSARVREGNPWYEAARTFGRIASERGGALRDGEAGRHHVIATGGGPGIMEAANRGAHDAGARSIGLNITLPHEQAPNPFVSPELSFRFRYFGLRKMHFMLRARALVAFPGGYGTLDELFEVLTLVQTGKVRRLPIVLVGAGFWRRAIDFEFLVAEGFIDVEDAALFSIVETAEEIVNVLHAFYGGKPPAAEAMVE